MARRKAATRSAIKRPATRKAKVELTPKPEIDAVVAELRSIDPPSDDARQAIELLTSWLADESGHDEETWPRLKAAMEKERRRIGTRKLFND